MVEDHSDRQKDHLVTKIYRVALTCFPEEYRYEYAEELLYAVRLCAAEAATQGRVPLIRLVFRELRDLPLAILRAWLHGRRSSMNLTPGAHLPGGPVRIWQVGAILLPFLLIFVNPLQTWLYQKVPQWLVLAIYLILFGMLVLVWVAGLARQLPVWTLPAFGILLSFVSFILHLIAQFVIYLTVRMPIALLSLLSGKGLSIQVGRIWPDALSLAGNIGFALLVQLLYLVIVVVLVTGLLLILPRFHARVRQEWTLLSFLLYGTSILPFFIAGDEFHGVELYQSASLLILIIGAGLYMLAPKRWQRVLALLLPAVLSPAVLSLSFYQLFPVQDWAIPGDMSFRVWEALQPVLGLATLPVSLVLASLAPRLPWGGERKPVGSANAAETV